jgi:endonuclease YncB( thermonuclease family)
VAVAILVASCAPPSSEPVTTVAGGGPVGDATVTRVYDGDTIEVQSPEGTFDVRLDGINAPDQGECLYQEATDHLSDTLEGRTVDLEVTGEDQFDRVLAWVAEGARDINLELVALGLALATTPESPADTALVDAEEEAYRTGAGLWSPTACGTAPLPQVEVNGPNSVFDPPGPDDEVLEEEVVVIVNNGSEPVELDGWVLRDESSRHRYRFADGTVLAPGSSIRVRSSEPGWSPGGSAVWSNDGDLVLVLDDTGRVVARHRY